MTRRSLADWLANAGLRNLPLEELVDGFVSRLNETGIPVARMFAGMNTLHPQMLFRSLVWDRATGPATHFEFQHADADWPIVQESPFADMLRQNLAEWRVDPRLPSSLAKWPVFAELRDLGMTDWLGLTFPFGELAATITGPQASEGVGQLWFVCSMATDRAQGFEESHLSALRQVTPLFALAVKAITMRSVGQGLLESYLAKDPAARVFAGTVRRGEVLSVEAVLFYADLRAFTALADTLPGRELVALLDDCFDCMVRPVERLGGEILKFMGDGLLAIFRTGVRRRAETCSAALAAASGARFDGPAGSQAP